MSITGVASKLPPDAQGAVHASVFPMAMVEGETHILRYVNPAFCQLLEETDQALLGQELGACLPECKGCLLLLERVHKSGVAESYTEQSPSSAGAGFWSYSAWPIPTEAGGPARLMIQVTETSAFHQRSTAMNQALMISAVKQHELADVAARLAAQMRVEIAERKKSEEALKTSETRLIFALEAAKAGTWEWNSDTSRLKWTDEVGSPPGSEKQAREVSYMAWRSCVYREDRPLLDAALQEAKMGCDQISVEFRVGPPRGLICWMLARGRLARDENGESKRYTGIFLDITERKHSEQMMLKTEKLASVSRLAATLAHEINNPLDAAINCLYIARTNPEMPEAARLYLDTADEELRRVTHMTRQSLGFYREATIAIPLDINSVLESVLQLLKNRIAQKSITIKLQFEQSPMVMAIFGELRQVFVNLLSNSLDSVPVHGEITLKTSVHATAAGERLVRVTVADNGQGIASNHLTRIFEPFFTTKGELGTGLGLWVTKQIVEKHRGTIRVRSSQHGPLSGTAFSIVLPALPRPDETTASVGLAGTEERPST